MSFTTKNVVIKKVIDLEISLNALNKTNIVTVSFLTHTWQVIHATQLLSNVFPKYLRVAKYCYSACAWFCYFLLEQSAQLFEQLFATGYCYVHTKVFHT